MTQEEAEIQHLELNGTPEEKELVRHYRAVELSIVTENPNAFPDIPRIWADLKSNALKIEINTDGTAQKL